MGIFVAQEHHRLLIPMNPIPWEWMMSTSRSLRASISRPGKIARRYPGYGRNPFALRKIVSRSTAWPLSGSSGAKTNTRWPWASSSRRVARTLLTTPSTVGRYESVKSATRNGRLPPHKLPNLPDHVLRLRAQDPDHPFLPGTALVRDDVGDVSEPPYRL